MEIAQRGLAGDFEYDPSLDREGYREIVVASRAWRRIAFRPRICYPSLKVRAVVEFGTQAALKDNGNWRMR